MERIPLYTNLENLAELYSIDRATKQFIGVEHFVSTESEVIFCNEEDYVEESPLYEHIIKEFAAGNYIFRCLNPSEDYLLPPFKTNLQEQLPSLSSIIYSSDLERVVLSKPKNGLLIGGIGDELSIYNSLNFHKEIFRASKLFTIGEDIVKYSDLDDFIIPMSELIINEPYLFLPEDKNYTQLDNYLKNNFESLLKSLLQHSTNKVYITICTYDNKQNEQESHWHDRDSGTYINLYNYIKEAIKRVAPKVKYKLWLVVSPMIRQARHDRFILTNYQYIESGAGLTFFNHRGEFIMRGEAIHSYSIMNDEARKTLIPNVLKNLQTLVIDNVKKTDPERIFGINQGDTYYLKFS